MKRRSRREGGHADDCPIVGTKETQGLSIFIDHTCFYVSTRSYALKIAH